MARAPGAGRSAALVGAGIFLSRIFGLVRQRVFSHYLGLTDAADVVAQSFRIPNLLQNLFGEGALSASFIPVYSRLVAEGREKEASRVAGAVAGVLALIVALLVLLGVALAPLLVTLLAPGFMGEKRELTITVVRILYPSAGILVMSAWCLGVLNSHRRFLLSYSAPVLWNVAIIAAVLAFRDQSPAGIAMVIAWGAVAGSVLQVLVQLPAVLALTRGVRISVSLAAPETRTVVRNFGPALMGRGVTQVSAYVDGIIASLLGTGAAMAVANAQMLYTLPVSLFGMSVSAAELPEMAAARGTDTERAAALRARLEAGLRRIAFFVLPCAVAFIAIGQPLATIVFQSGRFTTEDSRYVWAILAGAGVGLLAATLSRLTSSAFYALRDTRTPLRVAVVRVVVSTALGAAAAFLLPGALGVAEKWGAVGLTAASSAAAWLEFALLRSRLARQIGPARLPADFMGRIALAAAAAAAAALIVMFFAGKAGPLLGSLLVAGTFGAMYAGLALALGVPEARALVRRARA